MIALASCNRRITAFTASPQAHPTATPATASHAKLPAAAQALKLPVSAAATAKR